jgi:hypothetical protein
LLALRSTPVSGLRISTQSFERQYRHRFGTPALA